jgi:glutathione synthase/RimK-type ligase-like ATP-grasp enzyme
MRNILILTDYRNQLWLKSNYKEESVDIIALKNEFESRGYNVELKKFAEIDFGKEKYGGFYVFYQSSEDPNLFYKSYIEDILLGLMYQGAILIPDFKYFRAHHNKVFMEILRELYGNERMRYLRSFLYGTYEDYINDRRLDVNKKYVFKLSSGAQSKNVKLIDSKEKYHSVPKRLSTSINWYYWLVDKIKPFLKNTYPNYRQKSHNRKKFIIQQFIPDLDGDYKVLLFGEKTFVLTRKVRENDFRASGSGRFRFETSIPQVILDFAKETFTCFDVPFMSLDVAIKNNNIYLIEFQFVHFGTYTAEKAPHYFVRLNEKWEIVKEKIVIESEYANAIDLFINREMKTK